MPQVNLKHRMLGAGVSVVLVSSLAAAPVLSYAQDDAADNSQLAANDNPFDLDGDGVDDMLDINDDGIPDVKDLNHNGIADSRKELMQKIAELEETDKPAVLEPGQEWQWDTDDMEESDSGDSDDPEKPESDDPAKSEESADPKDGEDAESKEKSKESSKEAKPAKTEVKAESKDEAEDGEPEEAEAEEDTEMPEDAMVGVVNAGRDHVNMSTEKFIAAIGEQARYVGQDRGLYASVLIAQAVLESGSGNSTLAQGPNYNLFGIKGSYEGESVSLMTKEDDGTGTLYATRANFRKYPSAFASIKDYANLLRENPWAYAGVWKENAKSWEEAVVALQGVYATSTSYAESLARIINTYDLTRYDEPLPYVVDGQIHDDESDETRDMTMEDYMNLERVAISYLDTPYVWGGSTENTGFDCSGLVQWSYKEALDVSLPRTTYTQQYVGESVPLDVDQLRMGDLLFFHDDKHGTHHVAMYLSDGYYVHAPDKGDVIKVSSFDEYEPTFARRVLEFKDLPDAEEEKAPEKEDPTLQSALASAMQTMGTLPSSAVDSARYVLDTAV